MSRVLYGFQPLVSNIPPGILAGMSAVGWDGCPDPVREQVETLVARLQGFLAGNLVGVYLHGSLAMGCFNLHRSDVDVLAVIHGAVPVIVLREIVEMLMDLSLCPAPVEISLLRLNQLHPWRHPAPFDLHYSEDWRDRYRFELREGAWEWWTSPAGTDSDLAAHITLTRVRGIRLAGKPIPAVFPPVPPADYLQSILTDVEWARARISKDPVYAVLNLCRVSAYIVEGKVCSKEEGGLWALAHAPADIHPLIRSALSIYRGDADNFPHPNEITLKLYTSYLEKVMAGLETGPRSLESR